MNKELTTNISEKELLEWKYKTALKLKQYDRAEIFKKELEEMDREDLIDYSSKGKIKMEEKEE